MGARLTAAGVVVAAASGVAATPTPTHVVGIPDRALIAYVNAAADAPCEIPWWDLAGVGAVETGHGTHGGSTLDSDGRMTIMAVSYADAFGPMQFIRPTWDAYGEGDVNDIDDAAKATARLLCADGYEQDRLDSFQAYNGGGYRGPETREYADSVDRFAQEYRKADKQDVPQPTGGKERSAARLWDRMVAGWLWSGRKADTVGAGGAWRAVDDAMFGSDATSSGPRPLRNGAARADGFAPEFGSRLDAFIAAAPGEIGIVSGVRSGDEQRALREQNCPDPVHSDSTECTPWTAKVGTSDHEIGYAADLSYDNYATMLWAHTHAAEYGLQFDVSTEDWHVSLRREFRDG